MDNEELNFLNEELKRINAGIKTFQYGGNKEIVEAQVKLWDLREIIKGKIDDEIMKSNQTGKYRPERKGTAMSA